MTKHELQQYYWTTKKIQQLEDQLLELETKATRQTAHLSHEPKGPLQASDRMGDMVAQIADLRTEINKQVLKSYKIMEEIIKAIESLPSRENCLIFLRYVKLKSWEQIAIDMHYSWQHVHRIHANALRMLQDESK